VAFNPLSRDRNPTMGEMQLSIKTAFLFSVSIYVAIAASPLLADVLLSFLVSAFFWVLNGVCRIEIGQMAGICPL